MGLLNLRQKMSSAPSLKLKLFNFNPSITNLLLSIYNSTLNGSLEPKFNGLNWVTKISYSFIKWLLFVTLEIGSHISLMIQVWLMTSEIKSLISLPFGTINYGALPSQSSWMGQCAPLSLSWLLLPTNTFINLFSSMKFILSSFKWDWAKA